MAGVMAVMANSFKRTYARTVVFSAPDPMADLCQPTCPLETPRQSQAGLTQSLVGTLHLSPGSWCAQTLFVPCFPSPMEVLQSNPTGLQSQIPCGFSVPLLDPQIEKSVVGPITFLTVFCSLWGVCLVTL